LLIPSASACACSLLAYAFIAKSALLNGDACSAAGVSLQELRQSPVLATGEGEAGVVVGANVFNSFFDVGFSK